MDWNGWSGFRGNGTYIIMNKGSLTALEARPSSGHTIRGFAHCPHNWSQVWEIQKRYDGGLFVIKNVGMGTYLTATGTFRNLPKLDLRRFRSLEFPASVLDLDRGEAKNGSVVSLRPERRGNEHREPQKWLLQLQKLDEDAVSDSTPSPNGGPL
ncbi:MAG: hypothetical protein Q9182_001737 [Xanthomendoza sp. 2 TL-2023]